MKTTDPTPALPAPDDPEVLAFLTLLKRATYSPKLFSDEVAPFVKHTKFYAEVKLKRIPLSKGGASSFVTALDCARYIVMLRRESQGQAA